MSATDPDGGPPGYSPLVEWLAAALVVLGLLTVIGRFIVHDASGRVRLPRIVDDSIGMWVLRSIRDRVRRESDSAPTPFRQADEAPAIAAAGGQRFATTTARLAAAGVRRATAPASRGRTSLPARTVDSAAGFGREPRAAPRIAGRGTMPAPTSAPWSVRRPINTAPATGGASAVTRPPHGRHLGGLVAPMATALALLIIALVAVASATAPSDPGRRPLVRQTPDPTRSPAATRPGASAAADEPRSSEQAGSGHPARATARP